MVEESNPRGSGNREIKWRRKRLNQERIMEKERRKKMGYGKAKKRRGYYVVHNFILTMCERRFLSPCISLDSHT